MLRRTSVLLLLALAGCAQTRPVGPYLDASRVAIEQAEQIGAEERAPGELNLARQKLWEAEAAVAAGASEQARWLAEAAALHAEMAETTTLSAQAQDVLDEVQASIRVLREEIDRTRNR